MSLTKLDLLKPRFKVIADYLLSPFSLGEVLSLHNSNNDGWRYTYYDGEGSISLWQSELEEYPAIFQPLQWWEERAVEEMPEYVKVG